MRSRTDCIAARREGLHAARLGYPWDMNPFTQPAEAMLRIEWHVGWWEGMRAQLADDGTAFSTKPQGRHCQN